MRILVTGGAGFIGSHLVDALLDRGHEVAMADHLVRSPKPWFGEALLRGAQLYVADVRELNAIRPAFAAARPEIVLHLAAQADVRHSVSDPSFDAQVNVAGTVAVLEAAREVGTRRVVMASTAAVYGDPADVPTGEDAPIAPLSPYGASKAAAEWYLAQYQRLYGISTLALRMANVYGPRQDPHSEAGVVSIFCGMAASGGPRDGVRQRRPDARLRLRRRRRGGVAGGGGQRGHRRAQPLDRYRDERSRAGGGARPVVRLRP